MTAGRGLRIMHVCAPARSGGLETVVHLLATGSRQRGHEAEVALVLSPRDVTAHPVVARLREAGVPVHVVDVGDRAYLTERRMLRALMREQGTQILHTHGFRADVVDGGLASGAGAVHVTTLHGFTARSWRGRAYEWLQVRAAQRADAAVAVSTPIARRLMGGSGPRSVATVRNAVAPADAPLEASEARRTLGLPSHGFTVGWIGRLSFEKGPDLLLEALAMEAQRRTTSDPVLHVAMLGDGPLRQAMEEAAMALPPTVRVVFPGLVEQASRYLAAFDGLALTSRTEGTPMVILEAMLAGLPIVATTVGGVPDVLDDRCALLAEPTPHAIAAQLRQLEADEAARMQRAATALAHVEQHFGYDAWLAAYEQVYAGALGRAHNR
jgi:glycosyltransferase involved in cell wall biosynthesis